MSDYCPINIKRKKQLGIIVKNMPAQEVFHETSDDVSNRTEFVSRNEIVGWVDFHGSSKPVNGVVVGREMRGIVTKDDGEMRIRVQTYVEPHGNDYPLSLIPESKRVGDEFEITYDYLPEDAFSLDYSPSSPRPLTPDEAKSILPLITIIPMLIEVGAFEAVPVLRRDPLAHQDQQAQY